MGTHHTVQQGECLSSITKQYNLSDYRLIYDHSENAEFKRRRPDPNIIYPGDVLFIPDKELKEVPRSTDNKHKFKLKKQLVLLRIVVKDDQDHPYANKRYQLTVEDTQFDGRTNGQGFLEQKIPADATNGELKVWTGQDDRIDFHGWKLSLGHLDPVETVTGVQARLNNLGFYCGAVDGIVGPMTSEALRDFQGKEKLQQTGQIDAATRNRLKSKHDQPG
jgi:hypothetical protein